MIPIRGRATLINYVLTNLPIHYFSFYKVSSKVVLSLIAIQRKFLWVGNNDKTGIVWVSWDKLCLPKSKGDLGIKDLVYFNKVCYSSGCGGVSLKPIIFGMVYCYLEMAA